MEHTVVISRFIIYSQLFVMIYGHARLLSPPSRASKWRFGFSMPAADYDDNQGYCGGRSRLWGEFDGKCGVCGDAFFPIPRAHERGGRYYTGEITKEFKQGEIIEADVEVTANHRGSFEFKICPYDNPVTEDVERSENGQFVEVTQRCLDKHPIPLADGSGYQFELPSPFRRGIFTVKLRLPFNLVCKKCLFQWKYNTGNSWGKSHNGSDCMGCGHQEQFFSCADVKISKAAHMGPRPTSTTRPQPAGTTWGAWDGSKTPSFWTRVPGVPGWRQNPSFSSTTTTTTPKQSTTRTTLRPWWFFDKDSGWFNRDAWTPSTPPPPTKSPADVWDEWTLRPRTTRMPFWNRWFDDASTDSNPPNAPLVPGREGSKPQKKQAGFWENLFSRVRQNFWTWFFKGRQPGIRKTGRRPRPKSTRRTTTTTTMAPRTTSPWWKWWDNDQSKSVTTPAPKYRSWWDSYPWARVWDKTSDDDGEKTTPRPRPRWRPRSTTRATTTTTRSPWSTVRRVVWQDKDQHNKNNNNNNRYNGGHNHHHSNRANNDDGEEDFNDSSDPAQTSSDCHPVGVWTSLPGMQQWCVLNCAAGFCPEGYCSEGCKRD